MGGARYPLIRYAGGHPLADCQLNQEDTMTLRVFKCPYCGYRFRADPEKRRQAGKTQITRGLRASEPAPAERKRTVDLTCPNCEQDFEVEVEG